MPVYADPIDGLVIQVNLLQAWTARLVESLGTPPDAADVADVLIGFGGGSPRAARPAFRTTSR
jgi:hypothetical protein